MARSSDDRWRPIVSLIEALAHDPAAVDEAVHQVRAGVENMARLTPDDIARHTRALLAAATRALAEQRGPTEAELDFIEELAVTRARQGVVIEDVLTALHVAQRQLWTHARTLAERHGVDIHLLMDARDLYDDWMEQVRARLIVAHRRTELGGGSGGRRELQLLRRVLEGGASADLAAAEAGLEPDGTFYVLRTTSPSDGSGDVESVLKSAPSDLVGELGAHVIGVVAELPDDVAGLIVGVAGPLSVEDLGSGAEQARQALSAGEVLGREGLHVFADVAVVGALTESREASAVLADRVRAIESEGEYAEEIARTVVTYLECDRSVDTAAATLFVHPNTVRHRCKRFVSLTGMELESTFDGVAAWYSCRKWLLQHG